MNVTIREVVAVVSDGTIDALLPIVGDLVANIDADACVELGVTPEQVAWGKILDYAADRAMRNEIMATVTP